VSEGDFRALCLRLCREQGWELLPGGIRVPLSDGRAQLVGVGSFVHSGRSMVRLTTSIGPAGRLPAVRHAVALRINAELAHGALALRDDELVMVDTLLVDETGAPELEAAVLYLAETADAWEARLYGGDEN